MPATTLFRAPRPAPWIWLSGMRAVIFRFMMLVRLIVYLYVAVLAIQQPSWSRNVWYVFVLFGSAVLPMLLCTAVKAALNGYARYLPWLLLWYPTYVLLRRVITYLEPPRLPTRPVTAPRLAEATRGYREMRPDAVG